MTMILRRTEPQNPGLLPSMINSTRNFSNEELSCSCCGDNLMEASFLHKLQSVRDAFASPMHVSSAYRCPEYNDRVSSTGESGPHTTGRAVDIFVSGQDALRFVTIAIENGMTGIGISQKGDYASRFVHMDDLTDGVRPHMWSY